MIKSYFKLALKVLARKKFFTFISLFGISFTLMILMLVAAFLDNELGHHAPISDRDKMVYMTYGQMQLMVPDTTAIIDSVMVGEQMEYDTTYEYGEHSISTSRGGLSQWVIDNNLRNVQGTEIMSLQMPGISYNEFIKNKKVEIDVMATDVEYWQIFDFTFLEGKPFGQSEFENSATSAVITDRTAKTFFGTATGVVGEEFTLDKRVYQVSGVVKRPDTDFEFVDADVFFPYTVLPDFILGGPDDLMTGFNTVFKAPTPEGKELIINDLERLAAEFQFPNPEDYNKMSYEGVDFTSFYAYNMMRMDDYEESLFYAKGILIFLLTLFVLLPTLNLININVSRILERAAEIGVRKSFGANTSTILYQFVFENIILTFIGGLIGLALALTMLYLINSGDWLNGITLQFNLSVFLWSFFICLLFGVLSGLIPAFKMSRMNIAEALKSSGK